MSPNEYQRLAKRTLLESPETMPTPQEVMILWNTLGIAGEAGELTDYIKKGILHQHGVDRTHIKEELGDLLWYMAGLAGQYNIPLEDIMEFNVIKLLARYPSGFSTEASIHRST